MQHLETTTLEDYWVQVAKFNARRKSEFSSAEKVLVLRFHRLGNSILCEIYPPPEWDGTGNRLAVGISHKSHVCEFCNTPGDKWNGQVGKVLALWSALRDLTESIRNYHVAAEVARLAATGPPAERAGRHG